MSKNYNRKDSFYSKAKEEGYRSRAAYKLIEIDKKHRLLKPSQRVLDLGCWPGGWLQVASKKVGSSGIAVGIDLVEIEALSESNVSFICGDMRDDESLEAIISKSPQGYDVVLSDMSPKLSGIKELDAAQTVACGELALYTSEKVLKNGGAFVAKLFKNQDSDLFVKQLRKKFKKVDRMELDSTRSSSNEFYVIGLGFNKDESKERS